MLPPMRQVLIVYGVNLLVFPVIFAIFALGLLDALNSNLFIYGTLLEFLLLGSASVVFAIADHDKAELYGLTRKGLVKSLGLGLGLVALRAGLRYAFGAEPFDLGLRALAQSVAQPFPYNIGFAAFSAFSYGPLEMFYIIFLVVKLDQAFSSTGQSVLSRGSVAGVALWALVHLNNAFFSGLAGASVQVLTNFIIGLVLVTIFKYSRNSLGPIVCFTTFNLVQ